MSYIGQFKLLIDFVCFSKSILNPCNKKSHILYYLHFIKLGTNLVIELYNFQMS